jgi:Cu2+-containing amine oxidase
MFPGYDCPHEAVYLPAITHTDVGSITVKRAICIFEQDTGRPLTRHVGFTAGESGAVKGYVLTIRSVSTVGKYVSGPWLKQLAARLTMIEFDSYDYCKSNIMSDNKLNSNK